MEMIVWDFFFLYLWCQIHNSVENRFATTKLASFSTQTWAILSYMFPDRDDKHACLSKNWGSTYPHMCRAFWWLILLTKQKSHTKFKKKKRCCLLCVRVHAQCRVAHVGPGYFGPLSGSKNCVRKSFTYILNLVPDFWFLDNNSFHLQAITHFKQSTRVHQVTIICTLALLIQVWMWSYVC